MLPQLLAWKTLSAHAVHSGWRTHSGGPSRAVGSRMTISVETTTGDSKMVFALIGEASPASIHACLLPRKMLTSMCSLKYG